MTDDLVSRDALRELLFDAELPPPPSPEEMFDRTFAADGDAGADLLPPDTLYDDPAVDDDPLDDVGPVEELAPEHVDPVDVPDEVAADDIVDDPAQHAGDAPEHGDPVDHPGHHDLDPGTGW